MIQGETREVDDLIVVDPTHHDHVQFDRAETSGLRGARRGDRIETEVASRDHCNAIGA